MYCSHCGAKIDDNSSFCNKCGKSVNSIANSQQLTLDNPDKLDLKSTIDYFSHVCQLENEKFALQRTVSELSNKIANSGYSRRFYKPTREKPDWGFFDLIGLRVLFLVIGYALAVYYITQHYSNGIISATLFAVTTWETWAFLGIAYGIAFTISIVILIINRVKIQKKYSNEMSAYKNDVKSDNQRVEEEKNRIPLLEEHIRQLNSEIYELDQSLKKIYSYDVIFPKYRGDFVALNTMYEYLLSKRVYSLSSTGRFGNDGAYNLYESELRQNMILNKLDVIIYQLEQIKANQRMLYDAIQEATDEMQKISSMAYSISSIAENTALTAYNSKITADSTKALEFLATISYIERK
ncbi:MAG: zinc ribbon domain-containing protein [Ruminococcus sp.]|nr:zinc ribbon domain-containing protein [Ruminococcus sp.]